MIYHLLTESEPFSEHAGGALSRWVANVVREDDDFTIVCPWADSTWNFPSSRLWHLPGFGEHAKYFRAFRYHTALGFRLLRLKHLFRPLTDKLYPGDLIYIHNRPEYALALRSSCVQSGARLVLHMQNSHLRFVPKRYGQKLEVDGMVFCSAYLQNEPLEFLVNAERNIVIPNGADETCFFPASLPPPKKPLSSRPVALFVGRLVPEKGVHVFLEAMRILQGSGFDLTGRVVGAAAFGGEESSEYVTRLKQNKPANVEFADYLSGSALGNEFRKADIFCCPSTWNEPFGMVNVEAMATALPVVATAVGGIPEIFKDGGGLLIHNDSADELATAIAILLKDSQTRQRLSAEGYSVFQKRYRWQKIHSQYRGLVDGLIGSYIEAPPAWSQMPKSSLRTEPAE